MQLYKNRQTIAMHYYKYQYVICGKNWPQRNNLHSVRKQNGWSCHYNGISPKAIFLPHIEYRVQKLEQSYVYHAE